jgi:hypothetical protein
MAVEPLERALLGLERVSAAEPLLAQVSLVELWWVWVQVLVELATDQEAPLVSVQNFPERC